MARSATVPHLRAHSSGRHADYALRSMLAICGSQIALLGVALTVFGSSSLESGQFFLFSGLGLIVSGALLAKRHVAGAWTYMIVFVATLAWSLEGSGVGGSAVPYRLAGPIIMLAVLALLMPALRRWSRSRTVGVLSVLIIGTVLVGDLSNDGDPTATPILAGAFSANLPSPTRPLPDGHRSASSDLQSGTPH